MASAVLPHALPVPARTSAVPSHRFRSRPNAPRGEVRRASAGEDGQTSSEKDDDVPEWAKDLALDENGDLIDTKTGKALNEFGATRFDVAVRAMRGEYDPPGVSTEKEEVLANLYQFNLAATLYGNILENVTSENASRMTAMDSASNNAKDMISRLQIQYNRLRQAKITTELTEIVAGAESV